MARDYTKNKNKGLHGLKEFYKLSKIKSQWNLRTVLAERCVVCCGLGINRLKLLVMNINSDGWILLRVCCSVCRDHQQKKSNKIYPSSWGDSRFLSSNFNLQSKEIVVVKICSWNFFLKGKKEKKDERIVEDSPYY